jgi:hypothetical protein
MSTGPFLVGGEYSGRGADHPKLSRAKVKERVVIHLLPLWAFIACSRVALIHEIKIFTKFR